MKGSWLEIEQGLQGWRQLELGREAGCIEAQEQERVLKKEGLAQRLSVGAQVERVPERVRKSSAVECKRALQWCSPQEQEQEVPVLCFLPWQVLAGEDGDRLVEPRRL